jgi:hypothetical protein
MLTRRAALQGGTAVAASAAVGSIAAVAVVRNDADPVVDLGRQWAAIQEKIARLDKGYDERYAKLPERAKLGWPDVSDLPAFKQRAYISFGVLGQRLSLEEVKRYNRLQLASSGAFLFAATPSAHPRSRVMVPLASREG